MPELPEVETVRRGLEPVMAGASFAEVETRRRDLRFPFPRNFAVRLVGARVEALDRRGKYMIAALSTGESLIMHLGMSGRFKITAGGIAAGGAAAFGETPGAFAHAHNCDEKHDHTVFRMSGTGARIAYNDPRRFGFMDLVDTGTLEECRHFKGMGPEPLGNAFSADSLNKALAGRQTPIKAALLDQRVVAGLGNIYVCEALYRAKISPRRKAASVAGRRGERLAAAVVEVLREAIAAGGSSLRDFAAADGALGYFQHGFEVYDREGEACVACKTPIKRLVQGGRSTFFCPSCQR